MPEVYGRNREKKSHSDDNASYTTPEDAHDWDLLPSSSRMRFHDEMLRLVLEDDCLTVCARGLGLSLLFTRVLRMLCHQVDLARERKQDEPLIFVLNTSDRAETLLSGIVERGGIESSCSQPVDVTNKFTSADRQILYQSGGCYIVTSRILVVDLLTKTAEIEKINTVLVDQAHKVTDKTNEGFILNILRTSSKFKGSVKGFSDSPELLSSKFGYLSRVMQTLGVSKLHLWPRFHLVVKASLDKKKPDVSEVCVPLTPLMLGIQREVVALLEMCLKELRQTQNLDVSHLTVEDGLFKSFEITLRRQLDPLWHKVSKKTKQLVYDVGIIRRLLPELLHQDAVTFLRILDSIREEVSGNKTPSLWLLTDSADRLFQLARARVMRVKKAKSKASTNIDPRNFMQTTVLDDAGKHYVRLAWEIEENPKYGLLRDILTETRAELSKFPSSDEVKMRGGADIIIFVRDVQSASITRARLKEKNIGAINNERLEMYLHLRFKKWCTSHGLADLLDVEPALDKLKALLMKAFLGPAGKLPDDIIYQRGSDMPTVKSTVEVRLVLAEYLRRKLLQEKHAVMDLSSATSSPPAPDLSNLRRELALIPIDGDIDQLAFLEEMNPRYVVVFDPDVETVRATELYQAMQPDQQLKLIFVQYEDSVEEQRYLADLKREQDAFKKLIEEKAGLVLAKHVTSGVSQNATVLQDEIEAQSKRIVGYNLSTGEPIFASQMNRTKNSKFAEVPRIIVDMREFRSALPSLLHKNGIQVVPATLEIGDYILAPEICVERKSIPDLHGSFKSGRLFTQAEAMCKHYKRPNLLIEFDESKPFSLQAVADISPEISHASILSKMVLLTLHFPNLRLLWSPSPHAAVHLFKLMKTNYSNPDATTAATVGVPDEVLSQQLADSQLNVMAPTEDSFSLEKDRDRERSATTSLPTPSMDASKRVPMEQTGNVTAQEVLRRLPGITVHNYGKVMKKVRNLKELSQMSLTDLQDLIGKAGAARLYKFFNEIPIGVGVVDQERFMSNDIVVDEEDAAPVDSAAMEAQNSSDSHETVG